MNAQGRLCRLHTAQALQLVRGGSNGVSRTTPNHQVLTKWGGDICRDAGTVYKMGGEPLPNHQLLIKWVGDPPLSYKKAAS